MYMQTKIIVKPLDNPPKIRYNIIVSKNAGVSELADDRDSKSCGEIRVGSSPTTGTKEKPPFIGMFPINGGSLFICPQACPCRNCQYICQYISQ